MKKLILLITMIFLLTGCSATYEINITKDKIDDKITIMTESKNVATAKQETIDQFGLKIGEWENGHDFYKREIVTTDTTSAYQYTYSFDYVEYDAMSQIRKCYEDFSLKYDNAISLSTSKEFLCKTYYPDIDNFTIKITSEYEIANSNADKVEDNTHIWNINSKNYQNKPINLSINKSKKYVKKKDNSKLIKSLIWIGIFIILLIIFFKLKKDIKK